LAFWALDLIFAGWRGWPSFVIVLGMALLIGPGAAAIAYVAAARRPKVRAGIAAVFGIAIGLVLRTVVGGDWPAAVQISAIVALAVGMAIVELPAVPSEGELDTKKAP
jgi:hypothetical protein